MSVISLFKTKDVTIESSWVLRNSHREPSTGHSFPLPTGPSEQTIMWWGALLFWAPLWLWLLVHKITALKVVRATLSPLDYPYFQDCSARHHWTFLDLCRISHPPPFGFITIYSCDILLTDLHSPNSAPCHEAIFWRSENVITLFSGF